MRLKVLLFNNFIRFLSFLFLPSLSLATPLFLEERVGTAHLHQETLTRFQKLEQASGFGYIRLEKFQIGTLRFNSTQQIQNDFPTFEFKLRDDLQVRAIYSNAQEQPGQWRSWVGRIEGDAYSSVVLTVKDGQMAGEIVAFGENYSIKPMEPGVVAIRKLNLNSFQSGGEDVIYKNTKIPENYNKKSTEIHKESLTTEDNGSVIDLYVFYSDDAASASASIQTEIANDIAFTNTALDQSCTQTSLRLLGSSEITFTEDRDGDDNLKKISDPNDGYYDSIFDTLKTTGADMMQLWVEDTLGSTANNMPVGTVAGIANAALPYPGFTTPFSVKVRSTSAYVTAHEIGHNFTVYHDRYTCPDIALQKNYPYESGYGFVNLNEQIRDIMSYNKECSSHGFNCTVMPYYSNPRLFINGQPFGLPNQADAAYQIYKNRIYIAQIRPAATAPSPVNFAGCAETQKTALKLDKCFIATATYGSFMDPHVIQFRQFRDHTLSQFRLGQMFIERYYQLSPFLAQFINEHSWLKPIVRIILFIILQIISFPFQILFGILFVLFALLTRRFKTYFFLSVISLIFIYSSRGETSYNNLGYFSGEIVENPAALWSNNPMNIFSVKIGNRTSDYSSSVASSVSEKETSAHTVEVRFLGPQYSGWLYAEPYSKNNYLSPKNSTNDSWEILHSQYHLGGSYALFNSLHVGVGYRKITSNLNRDASVVGSWGVNSTKRVEDTQTGALGFRWLFYENTSLAGVVEYGQNISSDTAKVQTTKGAISVGYSGGSRDAVIGKFDVSYFFIPQSVGYEGDLYGNGFIASQKGYQIDTDFKVKVNFFVDSVIFGGQLGSSSQYGLDRGEISAKITTQTFKLGLLMIAEKMQILAISTNQTTTYSSMTEKSNSTSMGLSFVF